MTADALIDFHAGGRTISFAGENGNRLEIRVTPDSDALDKAVSRLPMHELGTWKKECDAEVAKGRQEHRVHFAAYWLRKRLALELERRK